MVAEAGVFLQDATLSASATLQINANVSVSLENASLLASGNNFTDGEAAFSLFVPAEVTKLVVGSEITRLIIN